MKRRNPVDVAVLGTSNWLDVTAELLRRAELKVEVVRVASRAAGLSWVLSRPCRAARACHVVSGGDIVVAAGVRVLIRRKLVWHWIGSDVLRYCRRRGLAGYLVRLAAKRLVHMHLADSPELAEELGRLGIQAHVCRLLPSSIQAAPVPLPSTFRVMSYWTAPRRVFYGGDTILGIAREMPDVEFLIVGTDGRDAPQVPNVRYLGRLANLDETYAMSTVFLRIPEHDSLSAMVLEALARGRYVIYNKDFPGCHRADTRAEILRALEDVRSQREPNADGARVVREEFSLQKEVDALAQAYARLLGDRTGRRRSPGARRSESAER